MFVREKERESKATKKKSEQLKNNEEEAPGKKISDRKAGKKLC